ACQVFWPTRNLVKCQVQEGVVEDNENQLTNPAFQAQLKGKDAKNITWRCRCGSSDRHLYITPRMLSCQKPTRLSLDLDSVNINSTPTMSWRSCMEKMIRLPGLDF
ncbi:hypothetical protein KSS87_001460, partial [Heliosperma pusillum]